MKTKILSLISLSILSLVLIASMASADTLATWSLTTDGDATSGVHENVTAGIFTGGIGITALDFSGGNGATAGSWTESTSIDSTNYFEFTLSPITGVGLTISQIDFGERKTASGPDKYQIQWSKNSDFSSATTLTTGDLTDDDLEHIINVTGLNVKVSEGETAYIRIFGYDADTDATTTTWRINDATLQVLGTATASPSLSITKGSELTTTQNGTVTVTNDGNVDLTGINLYTTSTGDFSVSFNELNFDLDAGDSKTILISSTDVDDLEFGDDNTFSIKANNSDTTSNTLDYTVPLNFCADCETLEDLEIKIEDITLKQGFGDDEDYWYPFDVIEAEIKITNDGNYDMEDIEVAWALYDDKGNKITDDEESDFNLDSDDDKTLTIRFALDENVDELEGVEKVTFYVRAKGKIDDKDSSHDGEDTCAETSKEVDLITDDEFMVIDSFQLNGMTLIDMELKDAVACGAELQIIGNVWNIGDKDQEDVTVYIRNSELGISKEVTIGDIDSFDYEKLNILLEIPENVEAKYYTLEFTVYNEDNEVFETDEENIKSTFKVLIKVDGNCRVTDSTKIVASLTSEAKAGKQLTVNTKITNTASNAMTYVINVADYASWATFNALDSNTLTLLAGESVDLTLTFDVNKGVSGNKMFNIEVISGDIVTKQPVSVTIQAQNSLLSGNVISSLGENKYLWVIGAVNFVLILAIIVVAIRLSKD